MPYDPFGNFTRDYNWVADKAANLFITASRMDGEFDNYATALNQVILRNGAVPFSGDIKLGGNKITGVSSGAAASPAIQFDTDPLTGFFLAAASVLAFSTAGAERGRFSNTGFSITGKLGVNTATPRTDFDTGGGIMSIRGVMEDVFISADALSGLVPFDFKRSAVAMYINNSAGNWTFNIRGDSTTTLNSMMAVGQMITIAVEVPQGATPHYCTAITVDGAAPAAIKWQGAAPTAGNANGVDVYLIRITKTAPATFQVRASMTQEK